MAAVSKVAENKIRRRARRLGLVLRKSRAWTIHADDFGEYLLADSRNRVLVGGKFDYSLDDVQAFLDQYEGNLRADRKAASRARSA